MSTPNTQIENLQLLKNDLFLPGKSQEDLKNGSITKNQEKAEEKQEMKNGTAKKCEEIEVNKEKTKEQEDKEAEEKTKFLQSLEKFIHEEVGPKLNSFIHQHKEWSDEARKLVQFEIGQILNPDKIISEESKSGAGKEMNGIVKQDEEIIEPRKRTQKELEEEDEEEIKENQKLVDAYTKVMIEIFERDPDGEKINSLIWKKKELFNDERTNEQEYYFTARWALLTFLEEEDILQKLDEDTKARIGTDLEFITQQLIVLIFNDYRYDIWYANFRKKLENEKNSVKVVSMFDSVD